MVKYLLSFSLLLFVLSVLSNIQTTITLTSGTGFKKSNRLALNSSNTFTNEAREMKIAGVVDEAGKRNRNIMRVFKEGKFSKSSLVIIHTYI